MERKKTKTQQAFLIKAACLIKLKWPEHTVHITHTYIACIYLLIHMSAFNLNMFFTCLYCVEKTTKQNWTSWRIPGLMDTQGKTNLKLNWQIYLYYRNVNCFIYQCQEQTFKKSKWDWNGQTNYLPHLICRFLLPFQVVYYIFWKLSPFPGPYFQRSVP